MPRAWVTHSPQSGEGRQNDIRATSLQVVWPLPGERHEQQRAPSSWGPRTENLRQLLISQQPTFPFRQHVCSKFTTADPNWECGVERSLQGHKNTHKSIGGNLQRDYMVSEPKHPVCLVGLSRDIGRGPTDDAGGLRWILVAVKQRG